MDLPNEHKLTARSFRTTTPSRGDEVIVESPSGKHTVTFTYPPDKETLDKIKYLRRYKSFIHETIIFSNDESPVINIFDSLIPKGCEVQFVEVEYKNDVVNSTMNIGKLNSKKVSSVHIKMERISEDDIHRCMTAVKENIDFGVKLSGWHQFDKKYLDLVDETTGESIGIFNKQVGKSSVTFWSEEKY